MLPFVLALTLVCLVGKATPQTKPEDKPAGDTTPSSAQDARIHRIEGTLVDIPMGEEEPPLRLNLAQLMQAFDVPGLSIAVIDNFQIAWAEGFGVIGSASSTAVGTKTLFQAGSISKPIAATGALFLVEKGQLSLDDDVNKKLKTWKVPDNEFTKDEKVTLRRLISHTAGLTVHGFPGYDVDVPIPTIVQVLNGEKPANTAPIRVDFVPGSKQRYSGGGITIEQLLMMDVTGKEFPTLMRETVLNKIGMTESGYEQPILAARAPQTANGTYADGKPVHGKWHIYPEMAAAGLWTTPTDLANFAIEIAQSRNGKSNKVLSQNMVVEMLTRVPNGDALGFFQEKENSGQFGHNGADEGFQAVLTMNWQTGKGAVIMANSDNGIAVADLLLRSVAREYSWNYKFDSEPPSLLIIAKLRGLQAALDRYTELKKTGALSDSAGERELNGLGYTLLYGGHEQDGIATFKRNVQDYPQSSNVYDSLGEAYMKTGQKRLAIENYEKSLQLDPKNENAKERLKTLRQP